MTMPSGDRARSFSSDPTISACGVRSRAALCISGFGSTMAQASNVLPASMASMRFRPIQPTPKKPMRGRRTSGLMRCPSACNSDKLFTRNSRTFYELVEAACLSVLRLVLMQEGQLVLVEDLEEVVPGNLLEFFLRFLEVDAQQTAFAGR